jgi:outer membrane protein OmpA-like peptidoglycan-associated protein
MLRYTLLAIVVAWTGLATAYDRAGHYYSAAVIARKLIPRLDPADARLIAFCAQLPDESTELDAVQVYYDAFGRHPIDLLTWSSTGAPPSRAARRMITVQQLLHALTGGDADTVGRAAVRVVRDAVAEVKDAPADPNLLCALGFALHLYGDAFAHRSLRAGTWWCHSASGMCMYPTGRGHADDMHLPDYPLYEGRGISDWLLDSTIRRVFAATKPASGARRTLWSGYVLDSYQHFPGRHFEESLKDTIDDGITKIASSASPSNAYGEYDIRWLLWGTVLGEPRDVLAADPNVVIALLDHHAHQPCQQVVDEFRNVLAQNGREPDCRTAWQTFRTLAETHLGVGCVSSAKNTTSACTRDDLGGSIDYRYVYMDPWPAPLATAPPAAPRPPASEPAWGAHEGPRDEPPPSPSILPTVDAGAQQAFRASREIPGRLDDVQFDVNRAELDPDTRTRLRRDAENLLKAMNEHPSWLLVVSGYADQRGSTIRNTVLSRDRAETVKNFLIGEGKMRPVAHRISTYWFASAAPLCTPADHPADGQERCMTENRRVQLQVVSYD